MIQSEDNLKKILLERKKHVVAILCEDPADLEKLVETRKDLLPEDLVVYCPFAPYDDPYKTIEDFYDKLEEGWTGETWYCAPK